MDEVHELVETLSTAGWFACPRLITPGCRYFAAWQQKLGVTTSESENDPFHSTVRV